MRVLVIGGTNFIGPRVVQRLVAGDHEVVVFHRGQTEADLPEGVRRVEGDRQRLEEHTKELRQLTPDVVLDMIPMNERDARGLISVFRGVAGRMVAVSSIDVYRAYDIVRGLHPGPPDPTPLDEDAPLRERLYPYRREGSEEYEKILVERAVMGDPDIPGTILRLPAVYGPGDYQHRLFPYVKRMSDRRPAILLGEGRAQWRFTHGYVGNVAAAIALAVTNERATGHIYNVGEAAPLPWAEWVQEIRRAAGWAGKVLALPRSALPPHLAREYEGYNFDQHWVADTDRIRRELGYEESVPRDDALRRTVDWEREHPPEEVDPAEFDYAAEDDALAKLE
jgi:nucleoside-diphosphate-sugar epimerase